MIREGRLEALPLEGSLPMVEKERWLRMALYEFEGKRPVIGEGAYAG